MTVAPSITDSPVAVLYCGGRGNIETRVRSVLGAAGISYTWHRAQTDQGLQRALGRQPNLVLIDDSKSASAGSKWLERLHALAPGVPKLMVGGPADEARTVDFVKAGAEDYVSADNLKRLPAVLTRMARRLHVGVSGEPAADAEDRHYAAFVSLARNKVWQSTDVDAVIREVTETVARTMGVERVSFWRLTTDGTAIVCEDLYEATPARHSAGVTLHRCDYPAYFQALSGHDVIPAEDARHDKRTREFAQTYLAPLDIASMLDAPVLVGGHLAGVLCIEQVGSRRRWLSPECNLALSAASLLALLMSRAAQLRSEAHLRTVVENEPACVKVVAADGRLLEMNPAGLHLIEAEDGREVFGRPVLDVVHPEDRKRFVALHRRVLQGETGDLRFRIIGRKGTVRWMETHSAPMPDATGRITGVLSVTHDITRRMRNEADFARQAQQQELLARLSVEAMRSTEPDGIFQKAAAWTAKIMTMPLGKVLRWNAVAGHFELLAGTGWKRGSVGSVKVAGGPASQAGYTMQIKAPVVVGDLARETRFGAPPLLKQHGVVSGLSVPIEWEGKVWGVLAVYDTAPRVFEPDEVAFLQSVANLLGVAIARLSAVQGLAASEANFRRTFAAAAVGLVITTPAGQFVDANAAYCRMLGYTAAELREISLWTLTHPDDRDRNRAFHQDLLEGRTQSYVIEKRYLTKDGRTVWAQVTASAHRDTEGRVHQIIGVAEDVTARRQLTEEKEKLVVDLRERVKELRALEQTAALLRRDDLSPADLIRSVVELIPPAMQYPDLTVVRLSWDRVCRSSAGFVVTPLRLESRFSAAGREGCLEIGYLAEDSGAERAVFLPEEHRLADSLVEMLRTHFERIAAAEALRQSQFRQRLILNSVDEGIHGIDLDGRVIFENAAGVKMLGWPEHELIGQPSHALLHHHHPDGKPYAVEDCPIYRTLRDGRVRQVDTEVFFHRDGSGFPVEYVVSPIRDDSDVITGAVVCFRDITQAKKAEVALRESEMRFRLLAGATNDAIWDLDLLADRLWWSEGHAKLFGHHTGETQASTADWRINLHPEDRDRVLRGVEQAIHGGVATYTHEYRYRRADGTYAYVLDRAQIIRDGSGRAVRLIGGMTDLSAIKQAEEEARRHSAALASIVDTLQEISYLKKPLTEVMTYMAQRAQQLTGADGAVVEMIEGDHQVYLAGSGTVADRIGEKIPLVGSLSGLAVTTNQALICTDSETDDRVDRKASRRVGLRSMIVAPLRDGETTVGTLKVISGEPARFAARDLTNLQILVESLGSVIQRQQATERLQASEERYRMLFDNNPHPMWVFDCETFRFLAVNAAALEHYGYSEQEFMAMTVLDIRAKQDQVDLEIARAKLPATGKEFGYRFHRKKDGTIIEMEVLSDALRFKDRRARLVLAQDVTERRRAERKVREQAELLDKAQDAILVRDLEHRITYWNKSAERLYGWPGDEARGRSVRELLYFEPKDFDQATAEVLAKGEWAGELTQQRRDGQSITIEGRWTLLRDAEGNPESVLAINTDITDRKKLEQQFLRAQRMESIGTLAGGIAHDLNNLLAPIAMGVELLRLNESNPRNLPVIDNIERSAKRGADLVKQVLSFARGVEGSRVAVHLKHIIHDIEAIVKNTFPKNIRLETGLPKDLWLVLGDPTQLNQVLLNLTVNARDAMPNGGLLSIRANNIELDQQYAVMNRGVPAGRYVVLEVSDTGSGIQPEILDRIFDPFFTTKEVGKGTGLGLSTLQGIVRSHGGFVNVYSELGRGSTFKIYLPVHETGETDTAPEPDDEKLPRGQGELILVVDDETTILSVTAQTLEAFGYRAITAEDGAQAIGLFAQRRDEIAVVLTDMMMPVMDGPALVAALRRINPRVHIIAASGLNANGNVARASAAGVTHFLAKPYSADVLLRLLANVLRGSPSRAPFPPPSK